MAVTGDVQKLTVAKPEKKATKSSKTAAHPPYFEMIKEALAALKERGGSSPHAIGKYMEEKHKAVLPANFRKMLSLQLKNSAAKGKLIKIKASYKLAGPAATEKVKKPAAAEKVKKPVAAAGTKRKAPESKAVGVKKAAPKKKVEAVKKMTPKKSVKKVVKPKQPKSIKSPAAKKTKKVA